MKKLSVLSSLAALLALGSCSFNFSTGSGLSTGNESNATSTSSEKKIDESKYIPIYSKETIRNKVGSYSQKFTITTYDGVYEYDVKYNKDTNTGIAIRDNQNEYYFSRGSNDIILTYYENDFGSGYNVDYGSSLDYMNKLSDISHDLLENAPFSSKTAKTYAGRECTEYVISNSQYIIPNDTKLYIVLDNETGAILQMTYDHIEFYKSTSFVPNDTQAAADVLEKKEDVQFDFFDTKTLSMFNLSGLEIPTWEPQSATYSEFEGALDSYSFQLYCEEPNYDKEKAFAKLIYEQGIKYDFDGNEKTFDELCDFNNDTVSRFAFDAYITIENVKYNVVAQATNSSGNIGWFFSLIITKRD